MDSEAYEAMMSRLLEGSLPRRVFPAGLTTFATIPLGVAQLGTDEAAGSRKKRRKRHASAHHDAQVQANGKKKRKKKRKQSLTTPPVTTLPPTTTPQPTTTPPPQPAGWTNQTAFGSDGSGATQLLGPRRVAISSDGKTAFVTDSGNSCISVWARGTIRSTDWTHQASFGSYGSGAEQLAVPYGVAVSSDDLTVLVADTDNHRISVWTRSSENSTDWTHQANFGSGPGRGARQFSAPHDVALSGDDLTAFVLDTNNCRVSIWTRSSDSGSDWSNQTAFGSGPGDGPDQFELVEGFAVASNGLAVFVGDQFNDRISVWTRNDSSGEWVNQTTFGSGGRRTDQFSFPYDLALSRDGTSVWVADGGNSRISIWTRSSDSSTEWSNQTAFGSEGRGPSQFDIPQGVALSRDSKTVWVADPDNHRISVWTFS